MSAFATKIACGLDFYLTGLKIASFYLYLYVQRDYPQDCREMINQEQIKDLHERISTLVTCLDIEAKRKKVAELQKQTEAPDFWSDPKAAEAFMKNMNGIKSWVTDYDRAFGLTEDLDVLYEFAKDSMM